MASLNDLPYEKELLLLLQKGDEGAFEIIYRKYSTRLFGYILKLVKDVDTTEDLLQEVFIKAWYGRSLIEPSKSYGAYLFTIARHSIYNYFRRASLETQVAAYIAAQSSELYSHVEEQIEHREVSTAIQQAIDGLPPTRRKVYVKCKIEGKTYQQVAAEFNCSVAAVNAHIVKATKAFRKNLGLTEPLILAAITAVFASYI